MNTPTLQALLLADDVYIDQPTGKHVVAGVFDRLYARQFPAVFNRTVKAFISLTNVRQEAQMTLKWVDLSDESVLLESPDFRVTSEDPTLTVRVVVVVPPFPLPHTGTFAFELHCSKSHTRLGALRVAVEEAQRS